MAFLKTVKQVFAFFLTICFFLCLNIRITMSDDNLGQSSITQLYISIKDSCRSKSESSNSKTIIIKPKMGDRRPSQIGISLMTSRSRYYNVPNPSEDPKAKTNSNSHPRTRLISPRNRIFTPNGDGINDDLRFMIWVDGESDPKPILKIFDLNGHFIHDEYPVYRNEKYGEGYFFVFNWNGDPPTDSVPSTNQNIRNNTKLANIGVYIYIFEINGIKSKGLSGTITLISDHSIF